MGHTRPEWAGRAAANIERLRGEAGLSRNELADAAHIPHSSFHRKISSPEDFKLWELDGTAEALGVTVLDLLAG